MASTKQPRIHIFLYKKQKSDVSINHSMPLSDIIYSFIPILLEDQGFNSYILISTALTYNSLCWLQVLFSFGRWSNFFTLCGDIFCLSVSQNLTWIWSWQHTNLSRQTDKVHSTHCIISVTWYLCCYNLHHISNNNDPIGCWMTVVILDLSRA